MSIGAYLILSSAQSGRRGLCVDVCKNAFSESNVKVFLSENENTSTDDEILGGFANVEVDGKSGVINTTGEFVIPCEYSELIMFEEEGLVFVKK
jgi:hypothetical protein